MNGEETRKWAYDQARMLAKEGSIPVTEVEKNAARITRFVTEGIFDGPAEVPDTAPKTW